MKEITIFNVYLYYIKGIWTRKKTSLRNFILKYFKESYIRCLFDERYYVSSNKTTFSY